MKISEVIGELYDVLLVQGDMECLQIDREGDLVPIKYVDYSNGKDWWDGFVLHRNLPAVTLF